MGSEERKIEASGAPGWLSRLRSDFNSGHDLPVRGFKPHVLLSAVSTQPTPDPLSPSVSAPAPLVLALKNKHQEKEKKNRSFQGGDKFGFL